MSTDTLQRRSFMRRNEDGTEQKIEVTWDKDKPTSSFKLESSGYSGASCITELKDIENIIGAATLEDKPSMYNQEDPRNVFIVGMD